MSSTQLMLERDYIYEATKNAVIKKANRDVDEDLGDDGDGESWGSGD